jgi:hypothetical protein
MPNESEIKIFCFRDNLEGEKYKYYGVTLYFVEGAKTILRVKPERISEVKAAIVKLVRRDDPIIVFVRTCISAGIGKTRCYFDAKRAGIAIRKQTQLALYELISHEEKEQTTEEIYEDIKANLWLYERVQQHFADELELYMGMGYDSSGLSECEAPTEVEPGDFVFEIGRLQRAKIAYWGHYRRGVWLDINIFGEFDLDKLEAILNGNVETRHRRISRQIAL